MLRFSKGWGVRELAREVGVSIGTISRWERMASSPPSDVMIFMSLEYGWDIADFLKVDMIDG